MFEASFIQQIADAVAIKVSAHLAANGVNGVQPRLLDTDQAAAYLGLPSSSALRQRKAAGQIPDICWVKMGGSILYDREGLDRWIAELKQASQ